VALGIPGLIAPIFALAGGTWIFLGIIVALFFVVVFGYYTRTGSGISQRPYRRPDGPPEAPSELAHDMLTQDVRTWERGTEGHTRSRRRPDDGLTVPAVAQALAEWRANAAGASRELNPPITATDRAKGPADAPPVVIWVDVTNEPCRSAYLLLSEFSDAGRIRLAVRQLPLADVHRLALPAAEALEAADAQGRFFVLLDDLAKAAANSEDEVIERAARLVPDGARLRQELEARSHVDAIVEQIHQATASGAASVPAVYIKGTRYDGTIKRDDVGRALRD
jgi:protein-disulfide isomerase